MQDAGSRATTSDRGAGGPCWLRSLDRCRPWSFNCLVFLAALAGTSLLIHFVHRHDLGDALLEAKLGHFRQNQDRYTALFFGTSRIHYGFVPQLFDEEMARHGHPMRTFNFAAPGMSQHEIDAFVDLVLPERPPGLRHVFVELIGWNPRLSVDRLCDRRVMTWHTLAETLSIWQTAWQAPESWGRKLRMLYHHALSLAGNYANLGEGSRTCLPQLQPDDAAEATPELATILQANGFISLDRERIPWVRRVHEQFLADLRAGRREIGWLGKTEPMAEQSYLPNEAALLRQVARIRAAGCEPVYVVPAVLRDTPEFERLYREGRLPGLIRFNDPARYPQLFHEDNLWDARHFNARGAEEFTRQLARRFAELLDPARAR